MASPMLALHGDVDASPLGMHPRRGQGLERGLEKCWRRETQSLLGIADPNQSQRGHRGWTGSSSSALDPGSRRSASPQLAGR